MSQKGSSPHISVKLNVCFQFINYTINFSFPNISLTGKDSIRLVTSVSLTLSTGSGLCRGSINICSINEGLPSSTPCHSSYLAWITGKLSLPAASIQGCRREGRRGACTGPRALLSQPPVGVKGDCWIGEVSLPKATEDKLGRDSEEEGKGVPCLVSSLQWASPPALHGVLTLNTSG